MIDLTNKCVLIRTHEEYENILKAAKSKDIDGTVEKKRIHIHLKNSRSRIY